MDTDTFKLMMVGTLSDHDDAVAAKLKKIFMPMFDRLHDALDSMNKSNQQLTKRMDEQDSQIHQLERKIGTLQEKICDIEQWGPRGSIRSHGLPQHTPGTVDEKVLKVINEGLKLKPPLVLTDIEVAHRHAST